MAKWRNFMALAQWRDSTAHSERPCPPDASSDQRSSAQKRTRVAGAKNLKNHEVALLHQHFLRRNKVQKDTVFVIHGVKQDFNNIRRKIRRLKDAQLKPLEDSASLPQLPSYIELRSPSPEFTQAQAPENRERSPQPSEEVSKSTGPQNWHTIDTQSDERAAVDDEDEIMTAENASLGSPSCSEIVDGFLAWCAESYGSEVLPPRDRTQTLSPSRKDPFIGAKPISMEIEDPIVDQGSHPRRESPAGSLMDRRMSWGGISVGSFIRDEVLTGTSPFVTFGQSPSLQSTSYLPKLEQNFMRDFKCCDQTWITLHDLLKHYEENHHNPSTTPGANINKQGLYPMQGSSRQPNSRPTQFNTSMPSGQNWLSGMGMQMPGQMGQQN